MKSWVVIQRDGRWGLYVRDYPCQGVNPSYNLMCSLTEDAAVDLVGSHLAEDLYGRLETWN